MSSIAGLTYRLAKEKGLEGIIAKRKSSIYRPGKRSPDWLKIKSRPQQEFVVCGFTEGKGSRKHFGALLLGAYRNGKLRSFGHSGTGFSQKGLAEAIDRLRPFFTNKPPVKTVRICSGFPGAWLILVTETRRSIIDKNTGSCEGWDAPPVEPR